MFVCGVGVESQAWGLRAHSAQLRQVGGGDQTQSSLPAHSSETSSYDNWLRLIFSPDVKLRDSQRRDRRFCLSRSDKN